MSASESGESGPGPGVGVLAVVVASLSFAPASGVALSEEDPEIGANDFLISPAGSEVEEAFTPDVVYNPDLGEYLVVWSGDLDFIKDDWLLIFGRRFDGDGFPVGNLLGIGSVGSPLEDPLSGSFDPVAAYNSTNQEYLVVWRGTFHGDQIHGRRLASDGQSIGSRFSISDNVSPVAPDIAYDSTDNEYLVVWQSDDSEILGQRLDGATGAEIGDVDFAISEMGGPANLTFRAGEPAVTYNSEENEYLVVWHGDDNVGGLVDNEYEIFGQRLDGSTGNAVGPDDFRISDAGGIGIADFDVAFPAVAYDSRRNQYLVVWCGSEVDPNRYEIYGQRLDGATGADIGENDFRISQRSANGSLCDDSGWEPAVAYGASGHLFLVMWLAGDDRLPGVEVFGQYLDPQGREIAPHDFPISDLGEGPDASSFNALAPAAASMDAPRRFLVVWEGDDDIGGLVDDQFEVFGQLTRGDIPIFCDGFESGDTSAW